MEEKHSINQLKLHMHWIHLSIIELVYLYELKLHLHWNHMHRKQLVEA